MNILHIPGFQKSTFGNIEKSLVDLSTYCSDKEDSVFSLMELDSLCAKKMEINNISLIPLTESSFFNRIRLIKKIIIEKQIDIVHVHFGNLIYLGILSSLLCNIPVILHRGSFQFKGMQNRFMNLFFDKFRIILFSLCTYIIANSNDIKKELIGRGVNAHKVRVIYRGINPSDHSLKNLFTKKDNLKLDQDVFTIGVVAAFRPEKNHLDVIRAAIILKRYIKKFKFILIGSGPLLEDLKKIATEYKVQNNLLFLGYKQPVYPYFGTFDITVLCSKAEPYGNCVVESMLYEKAVICSKSGGAVEHVDQGKTGLLYNLNAKFSLASNILYLHNNKEKRVDMGKLSRDFVIKNRNSKDYNQQVHSLYKTALK